MLWMESICGLRQMFLGTSATWGRKAAKSNSQWVIFRSLFLFLSLVSDWYSAQLLESLNCLPMFQKESIKGKKLLVKTLLLQEKRPNQFWLTHIIYTVRMYVTNSFTNMVKEKKKRIEYWGVSGILKILVYFTWKYRQIYYLLQPLRRGSDQISAILITARVWTEFSRLLNALTSNECTHIWVFIFSCLGIFKVSFLLLKLFCCLWKCFIGLISGI